MAYHTNDTIGGLLNASFGNATELIVSIFALNNGLIQVVQVSLLGSILYMTNPSLPFMASAAVFCILSVYAVLVTGRKPLSPG